MRIRELVDLYLQHIAETKKRETLAAYRSGLRGLVEQFGDRELGDLSPLDLDQLWRSTDRFPAGHRKAGELKAPDTRKRDRVAFDLFQKWALSRKAIRELVVAKIDRPVGRLRERIPTAAETKKILAAASPAFRLAYEALRQSGARPGELVRATFADLRRDAEGQLESIELAEHKTEGKTHRPRVIAIGKRLGELLEQAAGDRTDGALFLNEQGRPWTRPLLSRRFRELRRQLGLDESLVLYLSRHEHATVLTRKLGIHAAAQALGHRDVKTTQHYVKTKLDDLRRNQDAFDSELDDYAEGGAEGRKAA